MTDLESGAILAANIHPADQADTATIEASLEKARENVQTVVDDDDDDDEPAPGSGGSSDEPGLMTAVEIVADKGYYKTGLLVALEDAGFRPYIPEPKARTKRRWKDKSKRMRDAALSNRARTRRAKGRRLQRRRGEFLERTFAHLLETGGGRRTRLRGIYNVRKRYLLQAAAANLGLLMRARYGYGTPRGWANAHAALLALLALCALMVALVTEQLSEAVRRLAEFVTATVNADHRLPVLSIGVQFNRLLVLCPESSITRPQPHLRA